MLNYAICEINGKQYKVMPKQSLVVGFLGQGSDKIKAKTLLMVEDGKASIGKPYLSKELEFKVEEQLKGQKIRVFKYHPKANTRRTRGSRAKLTKLVLSA